MEGDGISFCNDIHPEVAIRCPCWCDLADYATLAASSRDVEVIRFVEGTTRPSASASASVVFADASDEVFGLLCRKAKWEGVEFSIQ